jgi:uncharacterized protein YbjQ (UPF0145 family)
MKKIVVLMMTVTMLFGCAGMGTHEQEGTEKGVAIGALTGAILGQIIGGDTKGTLIGAGIGALAGGAIGNKKGKQADEQEAALRRQLAAIEAANVQRNADILSITFRSDMLYDSGSANLKPGARQEISRSRRPYRQYGHPGVQPEPFRTPGGKCQTGPCRTGGSPKQNQYCGLWVVSTHCPK